MRISDWSSDVCSSDLPANVDGVSGNLSGRDEGITIIQRVSVPVLLRSQFLALEKTLHFVHVEIDGNHANRFEILGCANGKVVRYGWCRSEERRVGKGSVSTCIFRWSP